MVPQGQGVGRRRRGLRLERRGDDFPRDVVKVRRAGKDLGDADAEEGQGREGDDEGAALGPAELARDVVVLRDSQALALPRPFLSERRGRRGGGRSGSGCAAAGDGDELGLGLGGAPSSSSSPSSSSDLAADPSSPSSTSYHWPLASSLPLYSRYSARRTWIVQMPQSSVATATSEAGTRPESQAARGSTSMICPIWQDDTSSTPSQ